MDSGFYTLQGYSQQTNLEILHIALSLKILMITTLKELSKQKNLGRKARNVKNQMEILKLRETTVIKTE